MPSLLPCDLCVVEYVGCRVAHLRLAEWQQVDDVWVVGLALDDDVYPKDLQYSFRGLPSREGLRELTRSEPDARQMVRWDGETVTMRDFLAGCAAAVTVEVPRPPISTDAAHLLVRSEWLMESSGAPPPTNTVRLVTQDGLAGLAWHSGRSSELSVQETPFFFGSGMKGSRSSEFVRKKQRKGQSNRFSMTGEWKPNNRLRCVLATVITSSRQQEVSRVTVFCR